MSWGDTVVEAVGAAGRAPVLLVACDYDGTLAPIVDDPAQAHPLRPAIAALRGLAALPDTHVAVVSGRSLRDLAVLSRLPEEVHLVGSHGSEFEPHSVGRLSDEQGALLDRVCREMAEIADRVPGCAVETKPSGVAFHYRRAEPDAGAAAAAEVLAGPAKLDGVHVREGKAVVELSVVDTDKGAALDRLRATVGADTVVFIGDDLTDEDAFARLRGPDVGVKVGEGPTAAAHRVDDPEDVAGLLGRLLDDRAAWVAGHRAPAIERHSLLSDQRAVALVDPEARVSWMCLPRADGQAIFAELLGGPTAGFFAVRPMGDGGAPVQRYLPDSMVVETQWRTHKVTDYLDTSDGRPSEPAGHTDLIRVVEGEGPIEVTFAPRLDFGRNVTELDLVIADGEPWGVVLAGGAEPIVLVAPGVSWDVVRVGAHQNAVATVDPSSGPVVFELRLGAPLSPSSAGHHDVPEAERRAGTVASWREVVTGLTLPPVATAAVRRSALLLEALRYVPSGAMLAAATTSLPESVGGIRNWDYRYCWPRDASMSCASLARLGRVEPGLALLDWLCERVEHATRPDLLRPLYRVTGDDQVPEGTVAELAGYAGSRPVRIGNAAEHQVQLDALGPVAELVHRVFTERHLLRPAHWNLLRRIADVVVEHWREPDHGIWEVRLARQHNVVSKVMCWQVLDRAVSLAERTGRDVPEPWATARQAIVDEVCDRGWNAEAGSFVSHYDGSDLDAGLLLLGTSGFLDPTDQRFVATVKRVERELCDGPAVYRYRTDDGLAGAEGGMLICTGWLVQALVACGRVEEAADWFDRLLVPSGPTGLLPEQIDPRTERGLGNVPQAYSHLAVIDSALALAAAGVRG